MYYDDYSQANHFNLLLPQGSCCSAPLPENTATTVSIDLDNNGNSYAAAVKQNSQTCPSVLLEIRGFDNLAQNDLSRPLYSL